MNTPIPEIMVQGQNSHKTISIQVDVVLALVDAFMTKIPNEKRELAMALKVMRLHDDLYNLLKEEATAVQKIGEKRTNKKMMEEL